MEKRLIAPKNKDKFEIVTKILDKINNASYEYYSLHDINNLEKKTVVLLFIVSPHK